ncbi:MAG: hypothetical protein HQP61_05660 [Peptococcaceae bacterium]|nr:hypothetical protein [Candidatus Syntrophopropionicum ammoniitolerans]
MSDIFSIDVVKAAFIRSDGECECIANNHKHAGRCNNMVIYNMRGLDLPGGWEAYHQSSDRPLDVDNCRILCMNCYKASKIQNNR